MRDIPKPPGHTSILRLRGTVLCGSLWMLIAMAGDYGTALDTEATAAPQMTAEDAQPQSAGAGIHRSGRGG